MKTTITNVELASVLAAAIAKGQSKEELAEAIGLKPASLGQRVSNLRATLRDGLIARGHTKEEANEMIKVKVPCFPRGRSAGSTVAATTNEFFPEV